LGTGVKFNFLKYYSLSIVADLGFSQIYMAPLTIEKGLNGSGIDNFDPLNKMYAYTITTNKSDINLRFIPEIYIGGSHDEFIRIILEANIIDYENKYNFSEKSLILNNHDMADFSKIGYIGSLGGSFNHILSDSTKAIYGIKYSGKLKETTHKKIYPDKNNSKDYNDVTEDNNNNYIGVFLGFDTEITKYLFIRTGFSQGLYQLETYKRTEKVVVGNNEAIKTTDIKINSILPETAFCLGFYIQPLADFIIEFNFSKLQDWNPEKISTSKTTITDDEGTVTTTESDSDCNFGITLSYKI